ncbi:DUF2281 domain-containing protein [Nostoc mirabile]|uniref:DUF2281 domain-containing protein n=1 Tax=Nostoc mirabile TaxID=2907820 RepID=UPI001E32CE76|nr:DUF2281 domain-containing protein [Nostoc mirabile]
MVLYFNLKTDMINIILDIAKTQNKTIMLKKQITQELEKLPEPLLQEILDFVQFLQAKYQKDKTLEITIMSESSLQKDWLKPEEDSAWQDL